MKPRNNLPELLLSSGAVQPFRESLLRRWMRALRAMFNRS